MNKIISKFLVVYVILLGFAEAAASPIKVFVAGDGLMKNAISPGRMPVTINDKKLLDMRIGEDAILELPDGSSSGITYDILEKHPSGNQSWIGHFRDKGVDYRVFFTFGASGGNFGYILAPSGHYVIEPTDGRDILTNLDDARLVPAPQIVDDAIPPPLFANIGANVINEIQATWLSPNPTPTIDLLVVYTGGMVTKYGNNLSTLIDSLVAISNQAYRDSGVAMKLRLVGAKEITYPDDTNNELALNELSGIEATRPVSLSNVPIWRNSFGADLVAMLRPFIYPTQAGCGVAWIGGYGSAGTLRGWDAYGYSVVSVGDSGYYYCDQSSFTHELGHNMGDMHDHRTVGSNAATGVYNYSFGYGVDNGFSTIMAYSSSYTNSPRILKFSSTNENISCNKLPCGIPGTDPKTAADNASSMNNIRSQLAGWRPTTMPIFQDVGVGSSYYSYVEAIYNSDITKGCGSNTYCPTDSVSREQMAAFLVRAVNGEPQTACTIQPFMDVPVGSAFCPYIRDLVELKTTNGCGADTYCPTNLVSREQMAAFIVRAVDGEPPIGYCGTTSPFADVSSSDPFCRYIKRLVELGITNGCGVNLYCPTAPVSREQMAAFLARAFLKMQ